jgi:hypothetical protein
MKLFLVLLFLFGSNAYAVDYEKYIKRMKTEVNRLLGKEVEKTSLFDMPKLPVVETDSTSVGVYNKDGKIHSQGLAFNKLSDEAKRAYRVAFLRELYPAVRGAEINTNEIVQGINILEQGGTREGVYRSLVLSTEYMRLETYEEKPNEALVAFTILYGVKYLGLQFDTKQIGKLNLWGIKRIIVGKTLDILDAFPSNGKDLYKWYAILSEELSKKYSGLWRNKTRLNQSMEYHHSWAQKVPFQQIKSEVIVKIHKVMNSL